MTRQLKNALLILIPFLAIPFCINAQPGRRGSSLFYSDVIYKENIGDGLYLESIADLQQSLQKVTNRNIKILPFNNKDSPAQGIYVLLNKPSLLLPPDSKKLAQGSSEDFFIIGTEQKLLIVANHPTGLSRGIYTYLDQLGSKWYFPGEKWSYMPVLKNITFKSKKYFSPSFTLRDFFGTGGLFPVSSIDKNEIVRKDWEDWKRRNRIGGSIRLEGHFWETFNLAHEKELKKHPEYLAQIQGKRVGWHVSSKFCISNKELQNLFINDRINALKEQLNKPHYSSDKIIIPVDPSDGGGHCECADCRKLGTVSDRVFLLANLVAKAASKISSRAFVNLYGYNEHAAPPANPLEPNVIVQIIPYAFQNVGTPQQMIALWKKKCSNLFLYDYYGIPDWHYDAPLTGRWSPGELMKKIKYWKANDIKGVLFESSYSIGTTGMGLYLMSRMAWDVTEDIEKNLSVFYEKMFDDGAGFVKKYYDKINVNFNEIADVPYLYHTLEQAEMKVAGKKEILDRIILLKSYIHYALLYYQYKNSKDRLADGSWERLMKYSWEIYPTKMIHATRIAELLLQNSGGNTQLVNKWNIYTAAYASGVQTTKWVSNKEIEQYVAQDKIEYKVLDDFDYSPKSVTYDFISSKETTAPATAKEMTFLDFPDMFIRTSSKGIFRFSIRTNAASANNDSQQIHITLIDTETGSTVQEESRKISTKWQEISIKQNPDKVFQLYIKNGNWINISVKSSEWFYLKNIPTYSYPGKLWFYIPAGKKYFYFRNTADINPTIIQPDGQPAQVKKINSENIYQVPVSNSGKWWSIDNAELKFLEFYFSPLSFFPNPNYTVKESYKK